MSTKSQLYEAKGSNQILPVQGLRWRISARNLKDMDTVTTTDPYAKVYSNKDGSWNLIGTSERVRNVQNVNWVHIFEDKNFERESNQYWKIEVYDHDHIGKDQLTGTSIVSIDEFVRGNQLITVPLSSQGTITLLRAD